MKELISLLCGRSEEVTLDVAALQIASVEFPRLDPAHSLRTLDGHAAALAGRLGSNTQGTDFVAAANEYFFDELGFAGNNADYYNPRNSCLNEVLETRTGIPITLAVMYMEVARRLGRPVYGIGLPGHFVVRYDDGKFATYIDVFGGGTLLTVERCRDLALQASGVDVFQNPGLLHPVAKRHIAVRMLNNLRNVYFSRRTHQKAAPVLDLLIAAAPDSAEEYRQRALLNTELKRYGGARQDFETYLRLSPKAEDRAEVERQLVLLRSRLASLN
ncbi:MAG: transglutaminase-like domain-containing protein [Bryobacteraceae bacterium]